MATCADDSNPHTLLPFPTLLCRNMIGCSPQFHSPERRRALDRMTDQPPSVRSAPKLCHVAATTEGAVWVFEQLRELRDRHGFDVAAIVNGDRGALVDRLREAGIPVHSADFDFTSNADLLGLPRKVIALVRLLRRERFDIIQTHLFHSMVIGRIAAWF